MTENISDAALNRIHGEANYWKAVGFWVGFLKGIVASRAIEAEEKGALLAHSQELFEQYQDGDAYDVLEDLNELESKEMYGLLEQIISVREAEPEYRVKVRATNEFYGFLKGIACDGIISVDEVQTLLNFVAANKGLLDDPRISDICKAAKVSLADGVISSLEQEEILEYISKVVGDSMADTGISSARDIPQLDGMRLNLEDYNFKGKEVVLTGQFAFFKRIFWEFLDSKRAITKKHNQTNGPTNMFRGWLSALCYPQCRNKNSKAVEYRNDGGKLEFAMEHMLLNLMEPNEWPAS